MASVYKERGKWSVRWKDASGKTHRVRGLVSKDLAKQLAAKHTFNTQAVKYGLVDAKQEKYAAHAARPLADHIKDYRRHLETKKRTDQYVEETIRLIERVTAAAKVDTLDQIERDAIHNAAGNLEPKRTVKGGKLSNRSLSKALTAYKAFLNWMTPERILANPLYRLKGWDAEQDRRRVRKPLTEDEAVHLIETTAEQPTRGGMTGIDRMMRYALALGTGFRQGTLFSLTPASFHLADAEPYITVEAKDAKNRKKVHQPINDELAELVRPWLTQKPDGAPVFPKSKSSDPMVAWRHDLTAAGITYHHEDTALYCDQHSMRGSYITAIIRAAGLKVAQDLAHHSTPVLTSKYGQMGMSDYGKALRGLPALKRPVKAHEKRIG